MDSVVGRKCLENRGKPGHRRHRPCLDPPEHATAAAELAPFDTTADECIEGSGHLVRRRGRGLQRVSFTERWRQIIQLPGWDHGRVWSTGDWRDGPWYLVVGATAVVVGALIAVAGNSSVTDFVRWLAGAGIVIALAVPLAVLWRLYLRRGRGRHGPS